MITLDYDPRKVAERAVILGFVNAKPRRVTVDLTDSSRPAAIKAYTDHLPVTCIGTLVREGRQYWLRDMHDLAIENAD